MRRRTLVAAELLALLAPAGRAQIPPLVPDGSPSGLVLHREDWLLLEPFSVEEMLRWIAGLGLARSGGLVLLLSGYRDQGIQVVEKATGRILQTELQPAAFFGVAFSPDRSTLYASGGDQDVVYRYDWRGGRATLRDSLVLALKPAD